MPLTTIHIKIYTALLTQDGTTNPPTADILHNTLGDIIWSRSSTGHYIATSNALFPSKKTAITMGNTNGACIITAARQDDNTLYLDTFINGSPQDGNLSYTPVEIRIYQLPIHEIL